MLYNICILRATYDEKGITNAIFIVECWCKLKFAAEKFVSMFQVLFCFGVSFEEMQLELLSVKLLLSELIVAWWFYITS